jgi:polysaccharide deacetylase 2 family uncharacterized protein YibQ
MSDLTTPLGFKAPGEDKKAKPFGAIFAFGMVALAAVIGLWIVLVDDPYGGEPFATARIAEVEQIVSRTEITTVGVKSGSGELLPPIGEEPAPAEGEDPIAGLAKPGTPEMPAGPVKLSVVADPALVYEGPYGPIPKIAEDGRRPLDVYARPVPGVVASAPKVVVVVGGLGLSQTGTQEALRQLPPEVTLGFAPYGASLDRWAAKARQDGHELLLQVPLEPFDYPDNDPGPHTLLTSLDADKNVDRLHWLMARISTYVGVATYMGARFTAESSALDPVMGELAARGLMFLDDGTSSRSVAEAVAKERAVPFAHADLVIDAVPTEGEIVGRLAQLEQIARTRGIAVGTASALPVSVREIAEWAKGLDARGITLVPVSATQRAR